ncbi:uncharacterized protein EKO05_0007583 [Ascochyta rabiei]|uniref:uncharacterized protein n=1 Tax=Didymella rabiei TaxID=5454 RepID=UPI0019001D47|nr:uncharacterized protein EKO05_0007583 [Ascochyta rabiei]UPX17216.1 hypothetical protein EKO05_0007583 [Ascochyta rabiei]
MVSPKIAAVVAILASTSTATNFHVNKGCIYIDNNRVCAPNSRWVQPGQGGEAGSSKSAVEARLDTSNHCKVTFKWPSSYGDIFYGADNCLYDGSGQNIGGQCCNN